MAELTLEQAPQRAKEVFNRGFSALERGNIEYAIDLLTGCLEEEPALLQARMYLRAAELQTLKKQKPSAVKKLVEAVTTFPAYVQVVMLVRRGKAASGVVAAEKLMRVDALNPRFMLLFASAATAADLPEAAIQTLEIGRDHYPVNVALLTALGKAYQLAENTKGARECFEKVSELRPKDPEATKALKDAMALDSMSTDGWVETAEEGGTFRDIIKDEDEAVRLERVSKAVKSEKDADALIDDGLARIEAEPDNINHYRTTARLYGRKKMFAEAISVMQQALERNPGDPELDQFLSNLRAQELDDEISRLQEAGDEEGAQVKVAERDAFVLADLQERLKRYPNDLKLKFDVGVILCDQGDLNGAIQQFQQSQRSPKHRVESLYRLALCFKAKEQYDMAVERLEAAGAELTTMDETKKSIFYELGDISEITGDREKAIGYFKQIYQVDIGFRNVADKVERGYEK